MVTKKENKKENETGTWYHFYTPDTSGYVDTDYLNEHSLPYKYLPADPLENFVDKHQEYYDPRVALNLDIDFDGASNSAELLAGTNPFDADTDNDGVPDGYEMAWNKDSDGDGTVKECRLNITGGDILIKYNNGINALDPDSDDDGIYDGVEMGITSGVIRSEDDHSNTNQTTGLDWNTSKAPDYELDPDSFPFSNFKTDSDPTTTTNMTLNDTDNDGLKDTSEDFNRNGYVDSNEPDPNDMDSDDDGLMDGDAYESLADSDSDAVYNCLEKDSDGDGVYDGTEVGLTSPVQGNDEFEGTDIDVGNFVMDMDTLSTTDPWVADTDEDGLSDGVEDANKNGAWDWQTETDPNDKDTDDDGLADGWIDQEVWDSDLDTFVDVEAGIGTGGAFDPWEGEDYDGDGETETDNDDNLLETDPLKFDSDGDNLGDGDEAFPSLISEDEITNRQSPVDSLWYNSDPKLKDTDSDNLNDDEELIGWDVRIFWEATLETVKGPYAVWSDPENEHTDSDQLSDLDEFRYGSDPNMADSDDDNTNDKNEVDNNDNPTGIEGRPPEVEWLTLSTTPIVSELSGLYYLDGYNVKLQLKVKDSSGPYFIKFQELFGTPVQKYLQEVDQEYYATEVINDISVVVTNNGHCDYASAFVTFIEDSVGNNASIIILSDGLPTYSNDQLRNIYESNTQGQSINVNNVEWIEFNGTGDINVDGYNWILNKLISRIQHQLQLIIKDENINIQQKYSKFMCGLRDNKEKTDQEILDFLSDFNYTLIFNSQQPLTRGITPIESVIIINNIIDFYLLNPVSNNYFHGRIKDVIHDQLYESEGLDPFGDADTDGLLNFLEVAFGTNTGWLISSSDWDGDTVTDQKEFRVLLRTNIEANNYRNFRIGTDYIALQLRPIGELYADRPMTRFELTSNNFDNLEDMWDDIKRSQYENYRLIYIARSIEGDPIYLLNEGEGIIVEDDNGPILYIKSSIPQPGSAGYNLHREQVNPYPSIGTAYREIIIRYTNPLTSDTDRDGLSDRFEVQRGLTPDERRTLNSIPYSELPNPIAQDIYVEVDWMKDGTPDWVKAILSNVGQMAILGAGGIILGGITLAIVNQYKDPEHKFETDARDHIIDVFEDHEIILHIDDGSGEWNGGEPITHRNIIDHSTTGTEYNNLYHNNGLDGLGNYGFNTFRQNIFHYVVFAHDSDETTSDVKKIGNGDPFGNKFVIYDENLGSWEKQVKAFLHEFGHNILGKNNPTSLTHNPVGTHLNSKGHHDNSDCAMVKGHYSDPPQNYDRKCWSAVRIDRSF